MSIPLKDLPASISLGDRPRKEGKLYEIVADPEPGKKRGPKLRIKIDRTANLLKINATVMVDQIVMLQRVLEDWKAK